MGSITSADIGIVSELKIRYITALELLLEAQQHGRCRVRGVPADGEEAQWQLAGGRDIPVAVTGRNDGVTEILFSGIIKEGKVYSENGLYYVELELVTASDLLDRERRQRSFQNIHMTYEQAVRQILEPYGAGVICAKEARAALETPLIQYGETDWEFILRLGSRIHLPVFVDCITGRPQFYFGMREGNCFNEKLADYHVGISARYYEADEACSIARGGFLYYSITGDARYEMGDRIETGAGSFTVFRKYIELRQEALRCTHWMGYTGNWYIPAAAHRQLAGMEFTGIVTDTHAEKLKLRLDMDGERGGIRMGLDARYRKYAVCDARERDAGKDGLWLGGSVGGHSGCLCQEERRGYAGAAGENADDSGRKAARTSSGKHIPGRGRRTGANQRR